VQGSTTGFDSWADTRTRNESRVGIEYNAGYTSALAAFEELTSPTWPQCLQGFGYFSKVRDSADAHDLACACRTYVFLCPLWWVSPASWPPNIF
jgi:hypothetical protein